MNKKIQHRKKKKMKTKAHRKEDVNVSGNYLFRMSISKYTHTFTSSSKKLDCFIFINNLKRDCQTHQ